jgi:4-hydroxy-4-methyl-2-oxoglutarate aldolase
MSSDTEGSQLAAALGALGTSSVSDALDRCGIAGQPVGIKPVDRSFCLSGVAFTVRYVPIDHARKGSVGDFLDDVPAGSVVVIDNGGRLDATVWGDLMTFVAHRNGVAGTVVDGVTRDTARAVELEYPIFARSTFMRTGKDRVTVGGLNESIGLGGHRVDPGDLVIGDLDGIVVVPRHRAAEVLESASTVDVAEERIREALRGGARLDTARREFGYHSLQSVQKQP